MLRESRTRASLTKEVARAMALLGRAARARHLYRSTNAIIKKMMLDLKQAFEGLLQEDGELSLRIRADALVFDNEVVLEEPNPDASIPFIFYRDGIRKLDLTEGIEMAELEVLVSAIAEGLSFSGLGDDMVSYLWRHELEHIRYMVVDTSIVDAARAATAGAAGEVFDLDEQIELLLRSIYGNSPTDDVGPRAVRVDGSELAAKNIADTLDALDEMAPGFHPSRAVVDAPAYGAALREELEKITDDDLIRRTVADGVDALISGTIDSEFSQVADTMLKMYDAALVGGAWYMAAWIVRRVRTLADHPPTAVLADRWVAEAVGEARLRQVVTALSSAENDHAAHAIASMFEACGPTVVPTVLGLIPHIADPGRRRQLVEVATRIGVGELAPVRALLTNDQAFVAVEAVSLLAGLGTPAAQELLASAQSHAQAPVRLAMLQVSEVLPQAQRMLAAVQMLEDADHEVRIAAARVLGTIRDLQAVRAIENRVKGPKFGAEPLPVKEAFLSAFVQLVQVRGLPLLAKMFQDGGGLLSKKDAEDNAVAAAAALAQLGTPGAVQALKKAGSMLNKRVREAATQALRAIKKTSS